MATPEELINSIIETAMLTASTFTDNVKSAADDLIDVQGGHYFEAPTNLTGFVPTAIEPEIPTVADSILTYEAQLAEIVAMLSREMSKFFKDYYPLESDSFDESTAWLINTITNGGTGINADIEDAVWQRNRERIIADGRRVQNQITVGFTAKGHMMPQGAMNAAIRESLYDQAGKTGDASTAQAAKQLEIEISTIKFAIEESLKSRTMAMGAAADYIKALASAPTNAISVAELTGDAQAKMMSAAATWYSARQGRDDMILKSKLAELDSSVDMYKHKGNKSVDSAGVDASALGAAADAYGKTASAALSSLNSIISTSVNSFS